MKIKSYVYERVCVWNKKSSPDPHNLQKDSSWSLQPSDELTKGEVVQSTNCWWSVSCARAHSVCCSQSPVIWHGADSSFHWSLETWVAKYHMMWNFKEKNKFKIKSSCDQKKWIVSNFYDRNKWWHSLNVQQQFPSPCPSIVLGDLEVFSWASLELDDSVWCLSKN